MASRPAPQLVTRRNREFFLPSDCAPVGSALEAQLEGLTRRQQDAVKVEDERAQWERVRGGRALQQWVFFWWARGRRRASWMRVGAGRCKLVLA